MDLAKKYGVVGIFGLMMIVAANAANISDFLNGAVVGIGIVFIVFSLYKIAVSLKAAKSAGSES